MSTFKFSAKSLLDQSIEVDGNDISKAVTGLTIHAQAGDITRVELQMVVIRDGDIEAENAQVYISQPTVDALIALGWKPPEES